MSTTELFGKLVIVGKEGSPDIEFPLDKKSILIGRDHSCDIRIVNKEISRKHAEVYVEDNGAVYISSMGREPITVNGAAVMSPIELVSGDKIEVLLENRTRVFYFYGDDETIQIRAPARQPLTDANAVHAGKPAPAKGAAGNPGAAPPPPPPPMPPGGLLRAAKPAPAPAPASQQLPPSKPAGQPGAASAGAPAAMHSALQDAIKAGVQLKKVQAAGDKPMQRPGPSEAPAGIFVPNPADLLKLKAGLRKTVAAAEAAEMATGQHQEQVQQDTKEPTTGVVEAEQQVDPAEQMQVEVPASKPEVPVTEQPTAEPADAAAPAQAAFPPEAAATEADKLHDHAAVPAAQPAWEAAGDGAMADSCIPAAEVKPEEAAEELAGGVPPATEMRKRKSVRFQEALAPARVASTPEGAAREATITIRLRKGDIEQIINVDDNTVAFAQWGLGTMEEGEELPDTVVSKRSRHSVVPPHSAGKTPVRSALHDLLAGSPMVSSGAQATPGALGPAAPAPTPATGAAQGSVADVAAAELVVDPATLAAKLAEMAEAHDVTLEVPAVLFQSPAVAGTSGKEGLRVVLTPKSKGKTLALPAAAPGQEAGVASVAKSVPRTAGRSRLSQVGGAVAPHAATDVEEGGLEKTQEIEVPPQLLASAAAAQASARKAQPASRRRSLSRTPGTKVVIVEQATQTTPATAGRSGSAAKHFAAEAGAKASPRLLSTIAIQTEAEDCGDDVQQERSDEGGSADDDAPLELLEPAAAIVPLKQYQAAVLRAKAYHGEARQLAAQLRRMTAKALKLKKAATALSAALDEEQSKRSELQEALQQVVANRAAAELQQEEQAAAGVAAVEEAAAQDVEQADQVMHDVEQEEEEMPEPWVPRVVVLGRLTKHVSTAERAGQVVVVRPTNLAAPASAPPAPAPKVVVLPASTRKTPAPSAAKHARTPAPSAAKGRTPAAAAKGRTPSADPAGKPGASLGPSKTPAVSVDKSGGMPELPRSMLKEAPGTEGGARVVLHDVELPGWLFEGEQQAPEVQAAAATAAEELVEAPAAVGQPAVGEVEAEEATVEEDCAAVAAAVSERVEERQAEAPGEMEVDVAAQEPPAAVEAQAAAEAGSEAEEEEGEDYCHICGQSDEGDILLLCDSCDNACHLSCCQPPLKRVPKGDWFCVDCTARQQAEAAGAAAAKAKPTAKRGVKREAEEPANEPPAEPSAKPASRGKRGAVPAPSEPAADEAPAARGGGGRGSKRAAEPEPAARAEQEQAGGRGKRGRKAAAPAPVASEEPAPSGRTTRGRAAVSTTTEEVSTRRGRAAAAAPKTEAGSRSTRSRR